MRSKRGKKIKKEKEMVWTLQYSARDPSTTNILSVF